MDNSEGKECSQCVRVAVNVRPLVTSELLLGCTNCVTLVPGEPQVQIGSHSFTFDYVFSDNGLPSTRIFNECVAPLVDALFHGYNATVLAYGQTGSGKTYTMGTNYNGEEHSGGIIPMVMETIFSKVETTRRSTEYLIRVSFIEIFKEEVFDLLLDQSPPALCRGDGTSLAKTSAPARVPIQIRETMNGGITLAGVTEAEVRTKEEMASFLLRGSLTRATGSTNMNSQSSRSHAIFTITMEQKKISRVGANHSDGGDDILCAKLHLVDLAGSERAKRTGADGVRLREGIHINKGLLALGNVISALGDEKKRKEGGHVPYRDSKLTRLLQDSLGGNSKTVMIACVSPADTNAEESLNTLKYANRARNIQNKAVVNRDPMAAQMQMMRSQIEALQAELDFFRGDSGASYEELQILKHKISLLEASNAELHRELQENRMASEHLRQRALDAQVEKDKLLMKIESARKSNSWDEFDSKSDQDFDMVKAYVSKIQELEGELLRLQNLNNSKELKHREFVVDCLELDGNGLRSNLRELSDMNDIGVSGEAEVEVKELEHSSLQEKLDRELKELDKRLEQKEAEMKRFGGAETSVLKQHYEKKVHELELEKRALQKEIEDLRHSLSNISSNPDEGAQKLKENYLQKLNALETQVAELRKKQDAQAQILRQKQKSDEAAKRLQEEIHKIKTQKVQLQNKIKQESEQFRHWKASREKEVLQLKKEGRRNEYEMHKLLALNQRQKMVLQRKTEEAAMATKRLKELLESRKASSRDTLGAGNGHGSQALMQAIEHDLEVTVRVYEVRSEYERQLEERARMAKELAELKEIAQNLSQTNLSGGPQAMSPGARNSRIYALENMLATSSSNLVSMASHLSEAEERERAFSGRGRFNQVRTLAEAKIIMNFLFNLASSSRCHSWDKEVDCKEKDLEIKELKEKVVNMVRQMELQKTALNHMEQLQKLNMKEGQVYDLRPKGMRSSIAYNAQPMEDMDTSNSEHSDMDAADEWVHSDTDPEWEASRKRQPRRRNPRIDSRSGTSMDSNGSENMKLELGDDITDAASGNCCSCSKSSSCKTMRCECRAGGASCRSLCGCVSSKCSNRDPALPPLAAFEQLLQQQEQHVERTNETEKSLVTHGASLLQNALSERTRERNGGEESRRKPLSEIGNVAKPNAPKSTQRKKWRKSVIQLVPVAPTPQPENPPPRPENTSNAAAAGNEIPLQLPRAMRSTSLDSSSSSNLLRERNSGYASSEDVSLVNKDNGGGGGTQAASSRSSSVQQQPRRDEKENRGL